METMALAEAIKDGYTCALNEDGEYYILLKDVDETEFENGYDLFLGSKETFKFRISEKAMRDIVETYIENQDEVNNENEQLYTELSNVDFAKVCEIINLEFKTNYHSVTNIKLLP